MKTSESIAEITKAMAGFNGEFKGINADAANPFFKSNFISLDAILGQRGLLAKYGLALFQSAGTSEDGIFAKVTTRIMHKSGEWIESDPAYFRPVKADPQGMGSAISYAKRYSAAALLGIAEVVDDDGNNASGQFNNTPPPQNNYQQQPQYNQAPPQQAPVQEHVGLSSEQQTVITNLVREKGITPQIGGELVKKSTGKNNTKELTEKDGDKFIAELKKYVPGSMV